MKKLEQVFETKGVIPRSVVIALTLVFSIHIRLVQAGDPLTLEAALNQAQKSNPELAAASAKADAAHSAIRSQYWLDNPRLGLMQEKNLYLMQGPMGPELGTMNTWSVTQDIKFPAKYLLMGSAQKSRARTADVESLDKKLEIRKRIISSYYNLFAADRIVSLLEAERESLREVARSAESRHSTGSVPQQDEMKAHVEQTKIEGEILSAQEERETAAAALDALLNPSDPVSIELPKEELSPPKLTLASAEIRKLESTSSSHIQMARAQSEEADANQALARWSYAPDFSVFYKKAWSGAPADNYSVGVEISLPLWFFMKQTSEASAASSQAIAADKNLERAHLDHTAQVRSLTAKVTSSERLLQIYQTALIPQANSTLNSSRAAYRAGRVNFLELLDSERSLYAVRVTYYRTLSQYVETLSELEKVLGQSVSTLPKGDLL